MAKDKVEQMVDLPEARGEYAKCLEHHGYSGCWQSIGKQNKMEEMKK